MKILHLNRSDSTGGAAIAAHRLHEALRKSGLDSRMRVDVKTTDDWTVDSPETKLSRLFALTRPTIASVFTKPLRTKNPITHSPAILPSNLPNIINKSDVDIVHLHWINGEMLSVADVSKIEKPIVWTLHDMWGFCGAEHLAWDDRWRTGYNRINRPTHESGFDLNLWTWKRKEKHWKTPMNVVTPSNWLGNCVNDSKLMQKWPRHVIPNCIDTQQWKPINQEYSRNLLGLPQDVPLVLFGAIGGASAYHKGFDLLRQALHSLPSEGTRLELVIYGQSAPKLPPDLKFKTHYLGHLHDEASLKAAYCAADVLVIPSRQENLPNTAIEAQACGVLVCAFNIGGLPDIVTHKQTGYLAAAFDHTDLAKGIIWAMESCKISKYRISARKDAERKFSENIVCDKYIQLYQSIIHKS